MDDVTLPTRRVDDLNYTYMIKEGKGSRRKVAQECLKKDPKVPSGSSLFLWPQTYNKDVLSCVA